MFYKGQLFLVQVSKILPFCLLVAVACRICSAEFPVPTRVVGIYKHEKCATTVASSLAVDMFNSANKRSLQFSYESVQEDAISKLLDREIVDKLNNSVIITKEPVLCERLSKILFNLSSFLVCHGVATTETLELVEFQTNLYLSRPNPEALVHCLYRLIKLFVDKQGENSKASFIFDKNHPYSHIRSSLDFSLQNSYIQFEEIFNVISLPHEHTSDWILNENFASGLIKKTKHASLINGILHENQAADLLCNFFHNSQLKENCTLIFVGPSKEHFLHAIDNLENSDNATLLACETGNKMNQNNIKCNQQELRHAAEGHLLLEYPPPPWISFVNESRNITLFRSLLKETLNNTNTILDYDEAPLALDTVWAILKAINSAFKGNGQVSGESVGQALITKPFTGLTGDKFSFIRYRNGNGGYVRSSSDAVIVIYRFENGSYIPIGQHFNANSSFHWVHDLFLGNSNNHNRSLKLKW